MLSVELHGDTLSRSAMHEVFRVSLQMKPSPVDGAPCFGKFGGASRVRVSCIRRMVFWGAVLRCFMNALFRALFLVYPVGERMSLFPSQCVMHLSVNS